eukprot:3003882-Pyramimonas_sp.AAC.1
MTHMSGKGAPPHIDSGSSSLDRAALDVRPSGSGGPKPLDRANRESRFDIRRRDFSPNCVVLNPRRDLLNHRRVPFSPPDCFLRGSAGITEATDRFRTDSGLIPDHVPIILDSRFGE